MHLFHTISPLLFLTPATQDLQPPEAEEVVHAAIQAAGGEEVLAHFHAGHVAGKGTMLLAGRETPFSFEQDYELPDHFRMVVRCSVKGQPQELVHIVNRVTAQQFLNGKKTPLRETAAKELLTAAALNEVSMLVPLLNSNKYSIKPDKSAPAVSKRLLIQAEGLPEIRMSFDPMTGHLVRLGSVSQCPDTAKETELVTTFEDFRTVSGLTRSMRSSVTRDGHKLMDVQIEKITPLEKVDARTFALDQ